MAIRYIQKWNDSCRDNSRFLKENSDWLNTNLNFSQNTHKLSNINPGNFSQTNNDLFNTP